MRQEGCDFLVSHFHRVFELMVFDESNNPICVGLFRTVAVVTTANGTSNLIHQAGLVAHCITSCFYSGSNITSGNRELGCRLL